MVQFNGEFVAIQQLPRCLVPDGTWLEKGLASARTTVPANVVPVIT
jgi:hypothetical protein